MSATFEVGKKYTNAAFTPLTVVKRTAKTVTYRYDLCPTSTYSHRIRTDADGNEYLRYEASSVYCVLRADEEA